MKLRKKILFFVPYPIEAPSCRYRVHQFLPYLEKESIEYKIRPFVSRKLYKILYQKGHLFKKIIYILLGMAKRLSDLFRIPFYDVVFIHLESSPFPIFLAEYVAKLYHVPIIYDFDDAVFLKKENSTNPFIKIFKTYQKIPRLISLSSKIIVGNLHLKDFANYYIEEKKITIIPTSIDTTKFTPKLHYSNSVPVIGWIGSHSTFPYLQSILHIFSILAKRHLFVLKIVGASCDIQLEGVKIIQKRWSLEDEIHDFQSLDIGIYPLINSEWVRKSKIGFKAMQYAAVRVPCVASNLGFNKDIIEDGINGFLVNEPEAWIEKLSLLLSSASLRQAIGERGRKVIEEKFSVTIQAPKFIEIVRSV